MKAMKGRRLSWRRSFRRFWMLYLLLIPGLVNAHTHAAPKSATPQEYAKATGLETLFGALYLLGRTDRLTELFHIIINEEDK